MAEMLYPDFNLAEINKKPPIEIILDSMEGLSLNERHDAYDQLQKIAYVLPSYPDMFIADGEIAVAIVRDPVMNAGHTKEFSPSTLNPDFF